MQSSTEIQSDIAFYERAIDEGGISEDAGLRNIAEAEKKIAKLIASAEKA